MSQSQFCLAWQDYRPYIFQGLGSFQQNGALVDMTLAADGHYVKVHRLLISLVSPYLMELLDSANCPHPVIFLNRISYVTLSSILEYVYTGQAMVSQEQLPDLMQAAKELRIKGLEDMAMNIIQNPRKFGTENKSDDSDKDIAQIQTLNTESAERTTSLPTRKESHYENKVKMKNERVSSECHTLTTTIFDEDEPGMDHTDCIDTEEDKESDMDQTKYSKNEISPAKKRRYIKTGVTEDYSIKDTKESGRFQKDKPLIQYTVTPHGSIQLIVNRFIYFLRYTSRKGSGGAGYRRWQCVEYYKGHCPAAVVTKDEVVVSRVSAHNHPFHDRRILKKVQSNCVYTSIGDAEILGSTKRQRKTS